MRPWKTESLARRLFAAAAFACLAGAIALSDAREARAESQAPVAGRFSREGLERVSNYMRNEIATEKIAGAIVLIQQQGEPVYHEKFGVIDVASQQPMTDD